MRGDLPGARTGRRLGTSIAHIPRLVGGMLSWLRRPVGPGQALFGRIHRRLTLWYVGVLACALILFGVITYFGVQHGLYGPLDKRLTGSTHRIARLWRHQPGQVCPGSAYKVLTGVPSWACYSTAGALLGTVAPATITANFYDWALVEQALRDGSATATILTASEAGAMRVRAERFPRLDDKGPMGVVLAGLPVQTNVDTLDVLLRMLLGLGGFTLALATVGGVVLSGRALAPARVAFVRQQAFIADASHELRTPLTLLRADADVLLRSRERLSEDDAALLEDIVAETAHMSALATNLLLVARLDGGAIRRGMEVVDLAAVATGMARRSQAYAAGQRLTVTTETAGPVLVLGERSLIEQAVLVLIDNAMKYNRPGGSIILRAGLSGEHAKLTVTDTGIGIAGEHLPRLGERFYRVDKARSRETGGAGLGLSIAHRIAQLHGGSLRLASILGAGTEATLAIPAARVPEEE